MNTNIPNSDPRLTSLLRDVRVAPALPPRFQENVWRRVADAEDDKPVATAGLFDVLINQLLRPRFALVAITVLMIVGGLFGLRQATQMARHDAQVRYFASVAPNSLR